MTQNTTIKLDCGHEPQPQAWASGAGIPGYAILDGKRVCYDCADDSMRAHIASGNPCVLYISSDHRQLTTWTGGLMMRVTSARIAGRGFARQLYVTAVDGDGCAWSGRGSADNGTYVRMRRNKLS